MRVPEFRASLSQLMAQPGEEAQPFTHFLKLETPAFTPAPPDQGMSITPEPIANFANENWSWIGAISLSGSGPPVIAVANGHKVQLASGAVLPFPDGTAPVAPQPDGILPIDLNYDFKTDLVLAGAGGIRFFRQEKPESIIDATAQTKLSAALVKAAYPGAWAIDIEADGDLDIVAGAKDGSPLVLRNNGDGTFTPLRPFPSVSGVRQFVWADLNGDGNPDVALIDGSERLHIFLNQRSGKFREQAVPSAFSTVKAIAAADLDHSGPMALLAVRTDGSIASLNIATESGAWATSTLANVFVPANCLTQHIRLHVADLDNNGASDVLLTSPSIALPPLLFLQGDAGKFQPWSGNSNSATPSRIFDTADVKGNGRLDLLEISPTGQPIEGANQGTRNYHWQTIRSRARQTTGDQRVNSFGVGGEIEIGSGLLAQKQTISGPELHFGLGNQSGVYVARIVWPNGSVRAEFALKEDQAIMTEQRLKGSCPFLFAYNGKEMQFVKDTVPWGSAIGLRINSVGVARVEATEEWCKIGGDELVPHDGYYDLRITGELWETYYYDSLRLMAVDHPAGTEVFTDERFSVPAVKLAITAVGEP